MLLGEAADACFYWTWRIVYRLIRHGKLLCKYLQKVLLSRPGSRGPPKFEM